MDFFDSFLDGLNTSLEKVFKDAEEAIDDTFDTVEQWAEERIDEFNDFVEDQTLSPEERAVKQSIKEWQKEEYGPEQKTDLLKELRKKAKERDRRKIDEVVDPASFPGQVIHYVRKVADQEEEKADNRMTAVRNLFYSEHKKEKFELADHLFVRSGAITHHAIYVGGGCVIHYSPEPGNIFNIYIQEATIEEFAAGRTISCLNRESPLTYSRKEAVERAYSRLGENAYDFFGNNCEFFVRWCRCGGDEEVWQND